MATNRRISGLAVCALIAAWTTVNAKAPQGVASDPAGESSQSDALDYEPARYGSGLEAPDPFGSQATTSSFQLEEADRRAREAQRRADDMESRALDLDRRMKNMERDRALEEAFGQ